MTAIAIHLPSGRAYRRGSLRGIVLHLVNGFREALEALDRYEQLSHKSDAELATLQIRREDLPSIAVNGRT